MTRSIGSALKGCGSAKCRSAVCSHGVESETRHGTYLASDGKITAFIENDGRLVPEGLTHIRAV